MMRTVVRIDRDACNGCGLCVEACHEGAIGLVDGKARLLRDDYCDGMGDCLPACPCGAIAFEEREAAPYDEAAVAAARAGGAAGGALRDTLAFAVRSAGAPGTPEVPLAAGLTVPFALGASKTHGAASRLAQWPCQIRLVPVQAPYFAGCDLLVAADCTAFACADFHVRFMAGRVTLVGCPKLDGVDYAAKLADILRANDVRSVLTVRMDVPCCGGLQRAVEAAVAASGRDVPCAVVTLDRAGRVLG